MMLRTVTMMVIVVQLVITTRIMMTIYSEIHASFELGSFSRFLLGKHWVVEVSVTKCKDEYGGSVDKEK